MIATTVKEAQTAVVEGNRARPAWHPTHRGLEMTILTDPATIATPPIEALLEDA